MFHEKKHTTEIGRTMISVVATSPAFRRLTRLPISRVIRIPPPAPCLPISRLMLGSPNLGLADYGSEGSIPVLQISLDDMTSQGGDVQNMQLKQDIVTSIFRYWLNKPNFRTVICESLRNKIISDEVLGELAKELHLSVFEKITFGLALSDSEDQVVRTSGQNFSMAQIEELCSNPAPFYSNEQIQNIILYLSRTDSLAMLLDSFMQMLSLLQLKHNTPFVLAPFLSDDLHDTRSLRHLDLFHENSKHDFDAVLAEIVKEMSMADTMKELGYNCTISASNCREMLSHFLPLTVATLARLLGTISRTHVGLEDSQNMYSTFCAALGSSSSVDAASSSSWNVDVLVESIKQLAPDTDWVSVIENMDHEGFYFPDQEAFSFFMSVYSTACREPFLLHAICGSLWKNTGSQLSFPRYAVSAPAHVFTSSHSNRQLVSVDTIHGQNIARGTDNKTWLCLKLLEVLCQLAERGHASTVRSMLAFLLEHCSDVLLLGMSNINTTFNLLQCEVARLLGTISRTHVGLEDSQNMYSTFCAALGSSSSVDAASLSSWNVDVLVESIKQLAPDTDWVCVMENMDHEGFYFPDQEAFSFFMSVYSTACREPFPLHAICGSLWKNTESQLSFLRYAVSAPAHVFTFSHSNRQLVFVDTIHGQNIARGTDNKAWSCLKLLEALCQLAERGHASTVRSMLAFLLEHCSDVLLLGMSNINTTFNLLQCEVTLSVLPKFVENASKSGMIIHMWHANPNLLLRGFLDIHSSDPESLNKICSICLELKIIPSVLDMTPFPFSIKLAALASGKEQLNLEKWLNDNLSTSKETFFEECLKFLKEIPSGASQDAPASPFQYSGAVGNVSLETSSIFFKVLQSQTGQAISPRLSEEIKRLHTASMQSNPRLQGGGAQESSTSDGYPEDVEAEANSYFHQMFSGQLTIDAMVQMLARFKETSEDSREQSIFDCMIAILLKEYKFFPTYPERQLKLAAILSGSLIKHQLVTHLTLGIALRGILDALRNSSDSKMFVFGTKALEQFMERLVEWPQYCNHILQISHLRSTHADLVVYIEHALARISSGHSEPNGAAVAVDQHQASNQATSENVEVRRSRKLKFPMSRRVRWSRQMTLQQERDQGLVLCCAEHVVTVASLVVEVQHLKNSKGKAVWFIAGMGGLLVGYYLVASGNLFQSEDVLHTFFRSMYHRNLYQGSSFYCTPFVLSLHSVSSVRYIMAMLASLLTVPACRVWGWRALLRILFFQIIVAAGCNTFLSSRPILILGRIIDSFSIGMIYQVLPVFVADISPAHWTDGVAVCFSISVYLGGVLGNITTYWASQIRPWGWRLFWIVEAVLASFLFGMSFWVSEAPRSLLERRRVVEAKASIIALRGTKAAADEMLDTLFVSRRERIRAVWRLYRPRIWIAVLASLSGSLTGPVTVSAFLPRILTAMGFTRLSGVVTAALTASASILGVIGSTFLVEQMGRRRLVLASFFLTFVALVFTVPTLLLGTDSDAGLGKGPGLCLAILLCTLSLASGMLGNPKGWLSEAFPPKFTWFGPMLSTNVDWTAGLVVAQVVAVAPCHIKAWSFFLFALFCALFCGLLYFVLPETTKLKSTEIDRAFSKIRFWKGSAHSDDNV